MTFDLEVKSVYTFKGTEYYWMKEITMAKYTKFCANVESILLDFQHSFKMESGFSHM